MPCTIYTLPIILKQISPHLLKIDISDHVVGDISCLALHTIALRQFLLMRNDGDCVRMESTSQPGLLNLTTFQRISLQDVPDVFGCCLDANRLEILGGVLLLEHLLKIWILQVYFLHKLPSYFRSVPEPDMEYFLICFGFRLSLPVHPHIVEIY